MDRTERFYIIDRLLRSQRVVPRRRFLDELEVSPATFKRDLEYLRDRFGAPIVYDRETGGYRYTAAGETAAPFSLPGPWFSAGELHALMSMEALLEHLQPGILAAQVGPLRERLAAMLGASAADAEAVVRRVRMLGPGQRPVDAALFETVSSALFSRQRLRLSHYHRGRDEVSERTVSPQRLVHYRGNWYLDAWCHLRRALRSFAVDAIRAGERLAVTAHEVPETELEAHVSAGYGIFTGPAKAHARLRFSPGSARWVAAEHWHPQQRGSWLADGSYRLEVPYADDRELLMDVLRYGDDVVVEAPPALRDRAAAKLAAALAAYGTSGNAVDTGDGA